VLGPDYTAANLSDQEFILPDFLDLAREGMIRNGSSCPAAAFYPLLKNDVLIPN
jgi:hypothetical protein